MLPNMICQKEIWIRKFSNHWLLENLLDEDIFVHAFVSFLFESPLHTLIGATDISGVQKFGLFQASVLGRSKMNCKHMYFSPPILKKMYMSILNEGIYYIGWVRYVSFLLSWLYAEENNNIFFLPALIFVPYFIFNQ